MFRKQQQQVSISTAAKKLKVSTRAIQRACNRWGIGTQIRVGMNKKMMFVLSEKDVLFLNEHLQRRSGRPSHGKANIKPNPHARQA